MTRDKREDYIYSRAYGLHLEPITIVAVLVKEGYPEAAEILDSRSCATICARKLAGRESRKTGRRHLAPCAAQAPEKASVQRLHVRSEVAGEGKPAVS